MLALCPAETPKLFSEVPVTHGDITVRFTQLLRERDREGGEIKRKKTKQREEIEKKQESLG